MDTPKGKHDMGLHDGGKRQDELTCGLLHKSHGGQLQVERYIEYQYGTLDKQSFYGVRDGEHRYWICYIIWYMCDIDILFRCL